ncbi:PLDc_N domain-containing protein [Listeria seeligeri]|uniref:PLD nuclease N-terminal domain-containing protein n=1 Tax=Listeria seeligeri TaxID=1640 RepID=UPI0016294D78|nr:PLD nuclease N-terminal domain-containing protein [Listeria seeligeri]MBC1756592.1 PLDc_N domain-containing protein [Listeria seeligeri]MBC1816475.1 PLDc_N domain-containing protein [Listeria seeligeri]MBC2030709.1 PLDc_N domain-containing protein [Listeria seeligeri]MBC6115192.1 PLDc_N domain-containing protein [Listeria seeligeri]MBC6161209.1 PLDc_N domain-containing protein [Listeria seeligeri]
MDKTQIALLIPIIILCLALLLTAIIDLARNWEVRKNPLIWLFVIIFINIFGPVAYFIFGRKEDGR